MKLLIDSNRNYYLVDEKKKTFSTKYGEIKLSAKNKPLKSHLGYNFYQITPKFHDLLNKCKRGPQAVLLKDAAIIAAFTGINSSDLVVDAGTGSGWLAAFLAKQIYPSKLITYEKNEQFIKIAKENFKLLGVNNIKIKNKDVYTNLSEKEIDLLTLDLPEPWKVNISQIKNGGYAVAYLPQMTQVIKFVSYAEQNKFIIEHVFESQLREWKVSDRIARPEFQQLGHTAFLVFARKIE